MAKRRTSKPAKYSDDEEIIKEAYDRFKRCVDWESAARARFSDDMKFYNGDPDNGYQWPTEIRKNRDVDLRPCLTINKTRQYCLNITNDARQNKPSVKVRPVGDKATVEGSQVMEGIVRHIEYQSNAQAVYDRASGTQVPGGVGYWRILSDYADGESFDQELYIRPIKDPMGVYLDPDVLEPDASDMRFGFVFEDVPKDQFDNEYPNLKDKIGTSTLDFQDWHDDNHVRRCEYYRRLEKYYKLVSFADPQSGQSGIMRSTDVSPEILAPILADPNTKTREACEYDVQWFKIVGDQIVERGKWVGSTIPLVRIIGEESIIDGQLDRKGHVRALKDPQRIYNYWSSSGVEFVALQSKSPFIGAAAAIEGYETYWRDANTVNHSILPYKHLDEDGNPLQPPMRQAPPVMPQAYVSGMQIATEEFRMASGQYEEDMGEKSPALSGKAINMRQRQGDNATYHFIDNLAIGIRYTGKILIEAIPKIYDTQRTIKILGEDGTESSVVIDPQAQQEHQQEQAQTADKVKIIFNPAFAKYAVEADIGPAYATRRQEAFNAFTQIMSQNPQLMAIAGDLMFRAADFPMAEDLAERMKKMVPSYVLGKGPSPETQQLLQHSQQQQQQNQQLLKQVEQLMQQYAEERMKRTAATSDKSVEAFEAQSKKTIEEFRAETDRIKALFPGFDPNQIASLTAQLVMETLKTQMPQVSPIDAALIQALNGSAA